MSVRHLGTLYEGLLEHKVYIAKENTEVKLAKGKIQFIPVSKGGKLQRGHYIKAGEVYFASDPTERKSSGSYFTPEYVVNYIVTNTVGEKLNEINEAFIKQEKTNQVAFMRSVDDNERNSLAGLFEENALAFVRERVLQLSVLDPAMGSGHFLVNGTNSISNFITELLNELNIKGSLQSSTAYWRRWVVENCIYGVDINPLAVELAKLSLWILSMAKDQPLSFLKHHLKCGNSLVGTRLEEIGNYPFSNKKKEPRQLSLFDRDPDFKMAVEEAVNKLHLIASHSSTMRHDVEEKKTWLDDMERALIGYRAICSVHTDLYFGTVLDEERYSDLVDTHNFLDAIKLEQPNQYFHWELEFPEIFLDLWSRKQENSFGFDIVIGNPPYGADIPEEELELIKKKVRDTSNSNSAALFIDLVKNQLSNNRGVISLIVPKSILFSEKWFSLVKALAPHTSMIVDVEKAFEDVLLEQVVFVFFHDKVFRSYFAGKFINGSFIQNTPVPVVSIDSFRVWVSGITQDELSLGMKIISTGLFMENISQTTRGLPLQNVLKTSGKVSVIGGKNLIRFGINGVKGYLDSIDMDNSKVKLLAQPKIMSQRLVAHIQNPIPHIMIVSTVDKSGSVMSVDTVENTIITDTGYSPLFIVGLFNSKLVNWFSYKFIFCSAIRTMDFDNNYVGKIPVPRISMEDQKEVCLLTDKIISLKKQSPSADARELEVQIDHLVYSLYGLNEEEIGVIENN